MAVRTTAGKNSSSAGNKSAAAEQKIVALAEKLGWFLGTARSKADGWIGNEKVRKELASIRDGAAQLLQHIEAAARAARMESGRPKVAAKPKPKSAALNVKPSRGPVDAPTGQQLGQKNFKMGTDCLSDLCPNYAAWSCPYAA